MHLHYPFIFGPSSPCSPGSATRARAGAARPLQEPARRQGPARGTVRGLRAHRRAGPDRRGRPRLRALARSRRLGPYLRRAGERDPAKLVEMPNGVDSELFSPGEDRSGTRERLGIPATATVAAFVATLDLAHHFKRLDVAIDALAALGDPDVHLVVAGGGELLHGFRGAPGPPGSRTASTSSAPCPTPSCQRPAGLRPLPAHDRAPGVVRHRSDRGDGVRAGSDRDRLPRRPRGRRRRRDRAAGRPRRRGGVAAALGELAGDPERRRELGERGRAKALAEWSWPSLLERMDRAYAEAIEARGAKGRS